MFAVGRLPSHGGRSRQPGYRWAERVGGRPARRRRSPEALAVATASAVPGCSWCCPPRAFWRLPSSARWRTCAVPAVGGASSLLLAVEDGPAPEILKAGTRALLNGGADIHALNTVRRALSPLLGGGLAQACRADHHLAISDVVGDDPISIGSGPTVRA